jgi:hypothetical protein
MRWFFSFSFYGTAIVKKTSVKKHLLAAVPVVFTATSFRATTANPPRGTVHRNCSSTAAANKVRAAHVAH